MKRGRPARTSNQLLYDQFSDFDLAEQERVLEFLEEIHRQAKRQASKRFAEAEKPITEQANPLLAEHSDGIPF